MKASELVYIWILAAYVTHIIVTIKTSSWILLLIGLFVFPVAWINGTGAWFGAWDYLN